VFVERRLNQWSDVVHDSRVVNSARFQRGTGCAAVPVTIMPDPGL